MLGTELNELELSLIFDIFTFAYLRIQFLTFSFLCLWMQKNNCQTRVHYVDDLQNSQYYYNTLHIIILQSLQCIKNMYYINPDCQRNIWHFSVKYCRIYAYCPKSAHLCRQKISCQLGRNTTMNDLNGKICVFVIFLY